MSAGEREICYAVLSSGGVRFLSGASRLIEHETNAHGPYSCKNRYFILNFPVKWVKRSRRELNMHFFADRLKRFLFTRAKRFLKCQLVEMAFSLFSVGGFGK